MSSLRVLVADDHVRMRGRVVDALSGGGHVVVGAVGTAADAVAAFVDCRPDVVLLDVHMPGGGVAAAAAIHQRARAVPIVMLTESEDDDDLFAALTAGATGYIRKSESSESLATSVARAAAGEAVMSPSVATRLVQEFRSSGLVHRPPSSRALARLTPRERDILELLDLGCSTRQVAERLFLSPTTVRVHLSAAVRKLRVPDRQAAVALMREERGRARTDTPGTQGGPAGR